MAGPKPAEGNPPPVNPASFADEDTPKSPVRAMEDPIGLLNLDLSQSGYTDPEDWKLRLSLLIKSHLHIGTPMGGLPFRLDFDPVLLGDVNFAGSDASVGGGVEVQWGIPGVFHAYLRNAALYLFDQKSADWQLEGGVRLPTLFYDGPVQLGLGLAGGGYPLRPVEPASRYFTLDFNMGF